MTIFTFTFLRCLRKKSTFFVLFFVPLIMIFVRPLWVADDGMGFLFYGVLILLAAFSWVRFIMVDRINTTIVRIFAAPVTTFRYLAESIMAFWAVIGIPTFVIVVLGYAMYGWEIKTMLMLFLLYNIFIANSIAFTLAWNTLFRSKVMSDAVFSLVVSFMAMLGGIFIPLSIMPDYLRRIGMLFPTYWFSNALSAIQGQSPSGTFWYSIIILLLFSLAFLLLGSKRRLE